jgi:hypothetical protein
MGAFMQQRIPKTIGAAVVTKRQSDDRVSVRMGHDGAVEKRPRQGRHDYYGNAKFVQFSNGAYGPVGFHAHTPNLAKCLRPEYTLAKCALRLFAFLNYRSLPQ